MSRPQAVFTFATILENLLEHRQTVSSFSARGVQKPTGVPVCLGWHFTCLSLESPWGRWRWGEYKPSLPLAKKLTQNLLLSTVPYSWFVAGAQSTLSNPCSSKMRKKVALEQSETQQLDRVRVWCRVLHLESARCISMDIVFFNPHKKGSEFSSIIPILRSSHLHDQECKTSTQWPSDWKPSGLPCTTGVFALFSFKLHTLVLRDRGSRHGGGQK